MLLRGVPSMVHFELTPKKYLPLVLLSTSSFETSGPVYSIIRVPAGIGFSANKPRPEPVRLMAYLPRSFFIWECYLVADAFPSMKPDGTDLHCWYTSRLG